MSELALQLIREAKEKRSTRLDLGNCGLTELPKELFELIWLEELILANEWYEWHCDTQEWIYQQSRNDRSANQIESIPYQIRKLLRLKILIASGNNIRDLSPLSVLIKLQTLYLRNNQISDVNPLAILIQLQTLDLRNNQISDVRPLSVLLELQTLDLRNNLISDVNPLAVLLQLQTLDLRNNKINDVNPLSVLWQLQTLYLSSNQISNVKPLSGLLKLQLLDLSSNQISDVKSLVALLKLQTLYLRHNQISDLKPLSALLKLRVLDLRSNQIVDVAPLAVLLQLQRLYLMNNQIRDLEPLSMLLKLQTLDLRNNQICNVEFLAMLLQLQILDLSSNQISDLKPLSVLLQLQQLDLRFNQISNLKPIINLIEKGLPVSFKEQVWGERKITLYKNPLETPSIAIVEQGNEAILNYFKQLEEQGTEQLNEAKLIIVGEPVAGKTTLMETLLDENFELSRDTESTLGVEVRTGWTFPHPHKPDTTFTTNIWDFGGQQIQYMTHQFFLTPSAAYVLVSANDRKELTNFPYWFKIIHLLGEEQGRYSPVLVVLNEKDDKFINKFHFDRKFYEERYPELQIEVCEVDLGRRDDHFKAMRSTIQHMLSQLSHVTDPRPARWKDIRAALQERAKTANHITFDEYSTICKAHEVKDEESQLVLSRYLHKLGSLLHFSQIKDKRDEGLYNFIILNPQWAVEAVYSVLSDNQIAKNDGKFTRSQLDDIWCKEGYTFSERCNLLSLMKKETFEICYPFDDQSFIAPQLLNAEQPKFTWDNKDNLRFRFQYKFMPEGIITRLIVRLNTILACGIEGKQLIWRKGAVFTERDCRALVQEEENRDGLKIIDIAINGNVNERKYLLRRIRDEIQNIHHKWFRNIQSEQMIPCICSYCTNANNKDVKFFEYKVLQRAMDKGKTTVECDKEFIDVSVRGLLEGVFGESASSDSEAVPYGDTYNITLNRGSQAIIGKNNKQKINSDNMQK